MNTDRLSKQAHVPLYLNRFGRARTYKGVLMGRASQIINSNIAPGGSIGDYSCINRTNMDFGSSLGVFSYAADANIGMLAQIGSRVSIGGFEHPMSRAFIGAFQWGQGIEHWPRVLHNNFNTKESMALKPSNERVSIGPDVWIGNNSVVTSGVEIGVGSVIGAGSVVTKDTPPYSINVGNPTRIIGFRFQKDEIDRIVSSEFWTFPIESLLSCTFITSKTFNIDTFEIEIQRLKTGLKQSS